MTPILTHLHQHFHADWKQAPLPNYPLHFWYEAPKLAAYLEIGDGRLYVRWFDDSNPRGQYGGAGVDLTVTQTRAALDEALPLAVAKAALDHARRGLAVPAVPEWVQKTLDAEVKRRLGALGVKRGQVEAELVKVDVEYAVLVICRKLAGTS